MSNSQPGVSGSGESVPESASPVRVLYIDDDPGLARLVQRHLVRQGYDVEICFDGRQGLARLAESRFDVVALDHYMPGQDGLETLEALQRMPSPPPVVYVTGTQDGRVAVAALKAGAADYVIKDVQTEFIELLASAVEGTVAAIRMREARAAAEAEVRAARDRFQALAEEREILLREVNHRVGNSLQLIASLLQVQASAITDENVKHALDEARNRVIAVSQVHRSLYTSDQVTTIAASEYLSSLISDLRYTAARPNAEVTLTVESDAVDLDPDRTVALGVVVTELVINAVKYAYPAGQGEVRIRLTRRDGTLQLCVEDDGVGPGAATVPQSSTGIGTRILRAMAAKLNAAIEITDKRPGLRASLTFPEIEPPRRVGLG